MGSCSSIQNDQVIKASKVEVPAENSSPKEFFETPIITTTQHERGYPQEHGHLHEHDHVSQQDSQRELLPRERLQQKQPSTPDMSSADKTEDIPAAADKQEFKQVSGENSLNKDPQTPTIVAPQQKPSTVGISPRKTEDAASKQESQTMIEIKAATSVHINKEVQIKDTIPAPSKAEQETKVVYDKNFNIEDAHQPAVHPETKAIDEIIDTTNDRSKRMTRDTYEYLLELAKARTNDKKIKYPIAEPLAGCFEGESLVLIPGQDDWEKYCTSISKIIKKTFKRMCYATESQEKTCWRTRFFNILEAVYSTYSAETAFKEISRQAGRLKGKFPVVQKKIKDTGDLIKDFDDITQKNLYLTAFFPFEKQDLVFNKEDYESQFQHGENMAIPTECKAVKKVLQRAKDLKEDYSKVIGDILTSNGGTHFKCGYKSYLRTEAKLNELVSEKKERPIFKHLFDLLRCKAHFMTPEEIKNAYDQISSKFQILRLKNKLNTSLKNLTFNLVYKDIISEIQLVLGMPEAESENHILYEIERTHSIAELYEVVQGWGGYNFTTFKPLKGDVVEILKPSSEEKWVTIGDTKYRLLKSQEFYCEEARKNASNVSYFDESPYFRPTGGEKFNIRYPECSSTASGFFVSMCPDFPIPKLTGKDDLCQPEVHSFSIEEKDDVILKVELWIERWEIEGLKIHSKKGQVIELGKIGKKATDYVLKPPGDSHIVAFGGKTDLRREALFSLYCWIVTDQEKIKPGYQGELENGVPHGKGIMVYPDGSQYDGYWKNNKKNGKGVLTSVKGDVIYDGDWIDDMKDGQGLYCYGPNEWYSGTWKNDKRDGTGHYSSSEHQCHYHGGWKNGKLNGTGILLLAFNFKGQTVMRGQWEDNYCKYTTLTSSDNTKRFYYSGGVAFDFEKKLIVPIGQGVCDVMNYIGVGEWDHAGKGKGYLLGRKEKIEGEFDDFFQNFDAKFKGTKYYEGGTKFVGTIFRGGPYGGKWYHSNGAIIEVDILGKMIFYPNKETTKGTELQFNTKLFNSASNDSYYHAPSSTLYCGFYADTAIRFYGKAIDFLTEKGTGTWHWVHGEKITGDWELKGYNFSFEEAMVEYPNGNIFKGNFTINHISSPKFIKGTLTYKNGNKLEFTWNDDYPYLGEGTLFFSNGDKFIGTIKHHQSYGKEDLDLSKGKFHFSNGEQHELEFKSTQPIMYQKSNKVISYDKKGARFELDCNMELATGKEMTVKGICFYLNGDRYEGDIQVPSCEFNGKGTLYYVDGNKFEGVWDHATETREGNYIIDGIAILAEKWERDWLRSRHLVKYMKS